MIIHRTENENSQHSIADENIERLNCNYCEERFITIMNLMTHKKSKHIEKGNLLMKLVNLATKIAGSIIVIQNIIMNLKVLNGV